MEDKKDFVGLQSTKLNFNDIVETVTSSNCGAISTFIGTTRDNFEQKKVLKLEYEAYDSMALKEMQKVCDKIRSQWDVEKIAIYHRLGDVPVTEASIVIAISSTHRQESLQAVQFAIDSVKSTVPIWKKEVYENNEFQWKENKECLWAKSDAHEKSEDKKKVEVCRSEVNGANGVSADNTDSNGSVHNTIGKRPESLDYSSDGSFADSEQSTSNSIDYNMCQIKRGVDDMFSRIESFCFHKKQRTSMIKLHENCIFSQNSGNDNEDDNSSVCSRVNIIWTKHRNSKNRSEVKKVYNQWNPENTKPSTSKKVKNEISNYPSALEERFSTTEKILGMNKPVPKDVYERIKKIEDRILLLESTSPEYKNLWSSVLKETDDSENKLHKDYDDMDEEPNRKRSYSSAESDSKLCEWKNRYSKRFR